MNCTDIAKIMDEHAEAHLTTAERCALDEHAASCEPCALAWHAQTALLALPIPVTPHSLLAGVLRALPAAAAGAPRRARARIVVLGALLAAGVALATIAYMTVSEWPGGDSTPAAASRGDAERPATNPTREPRSSATDSAAQSSNRATPIPVPEVGYLLVGRTPPNYPPAAIERGIEGWVNVKFTIGANGAVTDATVSESSDPLFEQSAITAVVSWKYLPRVVSGKRVAVPDVQTIIRFQLTPDRPPPEERARILKGAESYAGFARGVEIAWQRAADDDFRGAELELDELGATYDLAAAQQSVALDFYGYIFTQYGDYGRAIAAYESAIALSESTSNAGAGWQGEWLALANLYFARHQYDMALKTLLRYKKKYDGKPMMGAPDEFIEKLRALGVTEETLQP